MSNLFQLLGMIFDDISEEIKFMYEWAGDSLLIECNDCSIVCNFILPLCEGEIKEQYQLLEDSEWFFAIIKITKSPQYQISEVSFITNSGYSIICKVGFNILAELAETKGVDDSYLKFCGEIAKKCGFLIDRN